MKLDNKWNSVEKNVNLPKSVVKIVVAGWTIAVLWWISDSGKIWSKKAYWETLSNSPYAKMIKSPIRNAKVSFKLKNKMVHVWVTDKNWVVNLNRNDLDKIWFNPNQKVTIIAQWWITEKWPMKGKVTLPNVTIGQLSNITQSNEIIWVNPANVVVNNVKSKTQKRLWKVLKKWGVKFWYKVWVKMGTNNNTNNTKNIVWNDALANFKKGLANTTTHKGVKFPEVSEEDKNCIISYEKPIDNDNKTLTPPKDVWWIIWEKEDIDPHNAKFFDVSWTDIIKTISAETQILLQPKDYGSMKNVTWYDEYGNEIWKWKTIAIMLNKPWIYTFYAVWEDKEWDKFISKWNTVRVLPFDKRLTDWPKLVCSSWWWHKHHKEKKETPVFSGSNVTPVAWITSIKKIDDFNYAVRTDSDTSPGTIDITYEWNQWNDIKQVTEYVGEALIKTYHSDTYDVDVHVNWDRDWD